MKSVVYTVHNSQSCRELTRYIKKKSLKARIHHISSARPLTHEEVRYFLICSHTGIDALAAKKSTPYRAIKDSIDEMRLSEIIDFIVENPKFLRFPIFIENDIAMSGLRNIDMNALIDQTQED